MSFISLAGPPILARHSSSDAGAPPLLLELALTAVDAESVIAANPNIIALFIIFLLFVDCMLASEKAGE
jgi:hypothetical protein